MPQFGETRLKQMQVTSIVTVSACRGGLYTIYEDLRFRIVNLQTAVWSLLRRNKENLRTTMAARVLIYQYVWWIWGWICSGSWAVEWWWWKVRYTLVSTLLVFESTCGYCGAENSWEKGHISSERRTLEFRKGYDSVELETYLGTGLLGFWLYTIVLGTYIVH